MSNVHLIMSSGKGVARSLIKTALRMETLPALYMEANELGADLNLPVGHLSKTTIVLGKRRVEAWYIDFERQNSGMRNTEPLELKDFVNNLPNCVLIIDLGVGNKDAAKKIRKANTKAKLHLSNG